MCLKIPNLDKIGCFHAKVICLLVTCAKNRHRDSQGFEVRQVHLCTKNFKWLFPTPITVQWLIIYLSKQVTYIYYQSAMFST